MIYSVEYLTKLLEKYTDYFRFEYMTINPRTGKHVTADVNIHTYLHGYKETIFIIYCNFRANGNQCICDCYMHRLNYQTACIDKELISVGFRENKKQDVCVKFDFKDYEKVFDTFISVYQKYGIIEVYDINIPRLPLNDSGDCWTCPSCRKQVKKALRCPVCGQLIKEKKV